MMTAAEYEAAHGADARRDAEAAGAVFAPELPTVLWCGVQWRILSSGAIEFRRYHEGDWEPSRDPQPDVVVELARLKVAQHEASRASGGWVERAVGLIMDETSVVGIAQWPPCAERMVSIIREHAPKAKVPTARQVLDIVSNARNKAARCNRVWGIVAEEDLCAAGLPSDETGGAS